MMPSLEAMMLDRVERKMTNYKLLSMEPTEEMVEAAEEAYMPFGDMDLALRMALLAAPDVQGEPVAVLLIDEPERTKRGLELGDWDIAPNATAIEAFARLAGPGAYQLYLAPQPAEQKPATDVTALVEAAEAALEEIESILNEAYNRAYPVCCGRAVSECCGSPDPEWDEADQQMMGRLAPHQQAMKSALAAHRKQGGFLCPAKKTKII